jgi:hypothetical protein
MAYDALRALKNITPNYGEIAENFEALKDEEDRALAIVAAALVEDAVESLLEEGWYRKEFRDVGDHKLSGTSGSFAAKIKDCFALGLIGPRTRDQLDCIREIRNAFAHAGLLIEFDDEAVVEACDVLPEMKSGSARDRFWQAAWDLCWGFHCWTGECDRMNSSPDPEDRDRNPVFY